MRLNRQNITPVFVGQSQPPRDGWLSGTIAICTIIISAIGILAAYLANENSRKDRLLIEDQARQERAEIRKSEAKDQMLAAKFKAITDLQQAYGNYQGARMSFIADYCKTVQTLGQYSINLKQGEIEVLNIGKENADLAQSSAKVIATCMALRKEFISSSVVFGFDEPNTEFLFKTLHSNIGPQIASDIAVVEKWILPLQKKAHHYAERHDGRFNAEFVSESILAIGEMLSEVRDKLLKDDIELEKIYSAYFKKCWASINEEKNRHAKSDN